MLEYLNFFLLCAIFASIFYLYSQVKRYLPLLKMVEELIGNLGYGTSQSDTKRQKLLECILTGNSNLYLGKVYTEEKIKELNEELNYITSCNIIIFWLPWAPVGPGALCAPYRYRLTLQYLQPEPIHFVIPNQLHLLLY